MLCLLLPGRHAPQLSSLVPSAASLLAAFSSLYSTQSTEELKTVVSSSELQSLPEATANVDRLLDSAQLESLAIFARYNITQSGITGQVILAKVISSRRDRLLVDPGYYGFNWISKQELASAVSYNADGQPIVKSALEILPGEYVKLRVTKLNTPYGDMQLDPVGIPPEMRQNLVWKELQRRMTTGQPVKGRILNPTIKGYAVGVAGYVALLEHTHVRPEMAQQIGTLQQFYVHKMEMETRKITLSPIRGKEETYASYRASM